MERTIRCCENCGANIAGRSDKKFCNDYCRNTYNNKIPNDVTEQIRPVVAILSANRKILKEALAKSEGELIDKQVLIYLGFNPRYCTEHKELNGEQYYFSFEFGFREEKDGKVNLLTKEAFEQLSLPNSLPELTQQLLQKSASVGEQIHIKKNR